MTVDIHPYDLHYSQEDLDDLQARLNRVRWPQSFDEQGWDYGTNTRYMKELVDYWINGFDWREQEAHINQYEHFKATVACELCTDPATGDSMASIPGDSSDEQVFDVGVHFLHIKGRGPNPTPLLMLHGYPWSWATFLRIIPMLVDPESHGGTAENAFTLVIPSLCGFCLSDQVPKRGFGFQHHPTIYNAIMRELGYERYGLYGGDWGGIITFPYGHQFPEQLLGIHINYIGQRMRDERGEDERDPDIIRGFGLFNAPIRPRDPDSLKFWKAAETFWMDQSGYSHVNMTCPQSFAHLVADSPVGAAAWIVEKYHQWSDWNEHFEEVFTKDDILTNVMLYWINNTFGTAIRIYYESHYNPWKVKPGNRIKVPTAILSFPKDIVPLLKSRAEQYYNVQRFKYMESGGHFGIFEKADEYAADLRAFFGNLP